MWGLVTAVADGAAEGRHAGRLLGLQNLAEAEVRELEARTLLLSLVQKVLWLYVPVHHPVLVQILWTQHVSAM